MTEEPYVLVLYYSVNGSVSHLAEAIALGVDAVDGITSRLRTVPAISSTTEATEDTIPDSGPLYVTIDDLKHCSGLALGSPTRFGNMAAPLKYFIDQTAEIWQSGALINKAAGVFTSTGGYHSGQETTLTSMMTPLLHHGAIIVGIPYSESRLNTTVTGGSPYGPTHVATEASGNILSDDEYQLALAFGKRLATVSLQLIEVS